MDLGHQFELFLRSRFSLICVHSMEEERVLNELRGLTERTERQLVVWDHAEGFRSEVGNVDLPRASDPVSALEAVDRAEGKVVFVLCDFHQCWERQPTVVRKLRSVAQRLKYSHKSMFVTLPPGADAPVELRDETVSLDFPPPGFDELDKVLTDLFQAPGVKMELSDDERSLLVRAALGLSANQAQRVFAKAIVSGGRLSADDIGLITAEKRQIIRASGALEFYAPRDTVADVGGLQMLKKWLAMRASAFGKEAGAYGLPAPKGIALIGIPGTGKSLTAKTIGSMWKMPLLRLDVGALFGSLVGQSEENTRQALRIAETVAPCLLWIDEIEKGLSTGDRDGGTATRVFATILSWMQEKTKPVFLVATANNISLLPPELLRRGRFDEIFFLDLPTRAERIEIFEVHIRKRGRDPTDYDVPRLADKSEGYVGAEIEQAVVDAMFIAFSDEAKPQREFTTEDIVAALAKLIPMSRSQRENIELLRRWLIEGRAQSASFREQSRAVERSVPVSLPIERE